MVEKEWLSRQVLTQVVQRLKRRTACFKINKGILVITTLRHI